MNTPGNWSNCTNGRSNVPDQNDNVIISGVPSNQPIVTTDTIINGISPLPGATPGGTITINSNRILRINDTTNEIESDITFRGATDNCSDCELLFKHLNIVNGATVNFYRGITFGGTHFGSVYVGSSTDVGHVKILPGTTDKTMWPRFSSDHLYDSDANGFIVQAPSGSSSTIEINGMNSRTLSSYGTLFSFVENYEIILFDNFIARYDAAYATKQGSPIIELQSCTGATITDTSWDELDFILPINATGFNFSVNGCSSLGVDSISVTPMTGGTNGGWGEAYAEDPDNVLAW
ncbi:MAG: hypothetical protein R2827_16225 [Bdellovibrionales bacterium]